MSPAKRYQGQGELIALTFDYGQVVVCKLAPLLLHSTTDLFPIALYSIPIYVGFASVICRRPALEV